MARLNLTFSISLLALLFFVFVTDVNAEPRGINLEQELRTASIVVPAKIVSYDSDSLKFQPLGSTNVISARYSTDQTWNPSRFILAEWPPKDEKVNPKDKKRLFILIGLFAFLLIILTVVYFITYPIK